MNEHGMRDDAPSDSAAPSDTDAPSDTVGSGLLGGPVRRTLPPEAASVSVARRFVAHAIGDVPAEVAECVQLMVSELATNCVVHAGTDFEVAVAASDGMIRVELTDRGTGRPQPATPQPRDPHGRGLRFVAQLATDWGVGDAPAGGSVAWFTLRTPARVTEPA